MASDKANNTTKDFFEICYRQYEFEMKETDQIYQRVSFVLVFLSLLGTIIFKLGRIDIFHQIFTRVDVFIYYLSALASFLLLGCSILYGILFILPRRSQYKTLETMQVWKKWRDDYQDYYEKSGEQDQEPGDALLHEITEKLAEAQANNSPINERRRQYFHHCVLMSALSIIPVSLYGLFYLIIRLQNI